MDRFIVYIDDFFKTRSGALKSNMDRFIVNLDSDTMCLGKL